MTFTSRGDTRFNERSAEQVGEGEQEGRTDTCARASTRRTHRIQECVYCLVIITRKIVLPAPGGCVAAALRLTVVVEAELTIAGAGAPLCSENTYFSLFSSSLFLCFSFLLHSERALDSSSKAFQRTTRRRSSL